MLKRTIFTLSKLRTHYRDVSNVFYASPPTYQTIQIDPQQLKQQGIKTLVLDFDGVLAPHGDLQPLVALHQWLRRCIEVFGTQNIFILSNKPTPQRIAYCKQHYADIRFIVAVKKKPYPDGLEQIIKLTDRSPTEIMLIDDRLLTGVLAACITKVQIIYIAHPYTSIKQRPIAELFFMSLRSLERGLFRIIK